MSNLALHATANRAAELSRVDSTGNNIAVKNFLTNAQETKLLSKVAASGLLSKAAAAGVTLTKLEPLIIGAAKAGILDEVLILTEAAGPDILPLLPTVVDLAPQALPLLALGLDIPPVALQAAALASIGAAYGIFTIVPDCSGCCTNVGCGNSWSCCTCGVFGGCYCPWQDQIVVNNAFLLIYKSNQYLIVITGKK